MIFTEPRFLLFFLVAFAVHWTLRTNPARKVWLLAASYAFYGAWDTRFLGLIVFSTLLDFVAAAGIANSHSHGKRRLWLGVSLAGNLGVLFTFKYFDFFVESAAALSQWLGLPISAPTLGLTLPVGISFYTFQTLSYTIDVYQGRMQRTKSLLDLSLYVAFFPQLVAGPIVRAREFLPQLESPRRFATVRFGACLSLVCLGFLKKACLANGLSPYLDPAFANPAALGPVDAWLAMVGYGVQLYGDFSGYSDLAIGTAGLLGYRLPPNFDAPFLARSPADFWRRWHISLSSWMRDYVYVPLGGNRRGLPRQCANLAITFLVVGLWHGAAWTMVAFGALHAVGVIATRLAATLPVRLGSAARPFAVLATFAWVSLGWGFFASPDLGSAATLIGHAFGASEALLRLPRIPLGAAIAVFALFHALGAGGFLRRLVDRAPWPILAAGLGVATGLALALARTPTVPFVYFQF